MPNFSVLDAMKELDSRRVDALDIFRPLPHQEAFYDFTSSEILLMGGNRSGKTVNGAVWFAAYLLDREITFRDGSKHRPRPAWQRKRPLLAWTVGYNWDHIGQTIYRVLFKDGLFDMIRDIETDQWVAYDPLNPSHVERKDHRRPAPALIPRGFMPKLNEWSWEDKKARQFKMVTSVDESVTLCAYPSTAPEAKAGDPVGLIWIDERLDDDSFLPEYQARLTDYRGRLLWTSYPADKSVQLRRMERRALSQEKEGVQNPTTQMLRLPSSDNAFLSQDALRDRNMSWSEQERRQRDSGEFTDDEIVMYYNFSPETHDAMPDNYLPHDRVAKILHENNGMPPKHWRRDMILDPGTNHPAILFVATAPPDVCGGRIQYIAYDEIYPGRMDADKIIQMAALRHGQEVFQSFIIDGHAGRIYPTGFTIKVEDVYQQANANHGLRSVSTGHMFQHGSDNIEARGQLLLDAFSTKDDGLPTFRVVVKKCPHLVRQLTETLRQVVAEESGVKQTLDRPAKNQAMDVLVCAEYFISMKPKYIRPPTVRPMTSHEKAISDLIDELTPKSSGALMSLGAPSLV